MAAKKKEKIRPLQDRVVLQRLDAETTSVGGIIIPEHAQERPQAGRVLAVGPDVQDVAVGDEVLFGRYSGVEVDDRLIVRVEDILGVVDTSR